MVASAYPATTNQHAGMPKSGGHVGPMKTWDTTSQALSKTPIDPTPTRTPTRRSLVTRVMDQMLTPVAQLVIAIRAASFAPTNVPRPISNSCHHDEVGAYRERKRNDEETDAIGPAKHRRRAG